MKEETLEIILDTFKVAVTFASLGYIFHIYNVKYGKSAEEKWRNDSIAEKQSIKIVVTKQNKIQYTNATGIYKKREQLKLVPLNLKE